MSICCTRCCDWKIRQKLYHCSIADQCVGSAIWKKTYSSHYWRENWMKQKLYLQKRSRPNWLSVPSVTIRYRNHSKNVFCVSLFTNSTQLPSKPPLSNMIRYDAQHPHKHTFWNAYIRRRYLCVTLTQAHRHSTLRMLRIKHIHTGEWLGTFRADWLSPALCVFASENVVVVNNIHNTHAINIHNRSTRSRSHAPNVLRM